MRTTDLWTLRFLGISSGIGGRCPADRPEVASTLRGRLASHPARSVWGEQVRELQCAAVLRDHLEIIDPPWIDPI